MKTHAQINEKKKSSPFFPTHLSHRQMAKTLTHVCLTYVVTGHHICRNGGDLPARLRAPWRTGGDGVTEGSEARAAPHRDEDPATDAGFRGPRLRGLQHQVSRRVQVDDCRTDGARGAASVLVGRSE